MSNKVIYKEIENNGIGFYGLLGLMGLFIWGGAVAFFTMEHHGHYISGMDNQIVWGMPHIFAIFLIVAASGALNVGSIGTVFGKKVYQPLGRLSGLLATVLLVGGLIILLLDLGRPDHVVEMFKGHLNFKSIFAWNMILYGGFIALVGLYIWTMMDRKAKKYYKPVGFSAFTWRLILTTGTGSIFGFLVARQAYDAAIMAPLFIVLSFSTGLAVFIVVTMATYKMTGRPIGDVILNKLRYLLGIFILGLLLLEATRHLTNLYATEHHAVEAFILDGDNIYTTLFWFGFVLFGSLLPVALVYCRQLINNRTSLFVAALLTIMGGFSLLYVIVIGGQAFPLELFPNAVVTSDSFDGVMNHYSPSMYEVLLGLGGVAVMLALFMVAVKVLRFMPTSLADNVVDPHTK
ncbi:MAG: Sulfite reduction-associated complex DsrMKJOP protein DsrP (= HmeB) [uncultured Thiotrichaceae bacterium]|uniref:Sulfite reduction-associated complex DsrMKJOP protein DsrP (= HmeB) n=1 Tax=uncultured Thiotrichaceae bacterium TaxID=298394 RepID=A0A6S6U538_9GAMM|nr:MAG: Sulfite reduction-associated complex DsrMKJOP protein DsrP (= HmeB) [uncultured Thiotrichaceae bacterium]